MNFHIEHRIWAALPALEAAVLDPARVDRLPSVSPFIRTARVLTLHQEGHTVERRARMSAQGLRAQVGPWLLLDDVTWDDHVVWDLRTHVGTFVIDPHLPESLRSHVSCQGSYRLIADGPAVTIRAIEAEVEVAVPALGSAIREAIVRLLRIHFDHDVGLLTSLAHAHATESPDGRICLTPV
ncbi:MAG TPA: hypothetical protein VGF45_01425 [Polyangia bacterium]